MDETVISKPFPELLKPILKVFLPRGCQDKHYRQAVTAAAVAVWPHSMRRDI